MIHNDHTINDICLSLINNGTLYRKHMELAARNATTAEWAVYLRDLGLPVWRSHHGGHHVNIEQRREAALTLREYYARHIAEG